MVVIPAKAGIQSFQGILDPRFRGGDRKREFFGNLLERAPRMRIKISSGLVCGILLLGLVGPATAVTTYDYPFQTPPGATVGGQPVSASAIVELYPDTDQINVYLYNNQANPTSVIQNLSDFGFVLSTGQAAGSIRGDDATLIEVSASKNFSLVNSSGTGWELQNNYNFIPLENGIAVGTLGTGLRLQVLGTPAGPANTIIGYFDWDSYTYANANGSIAGNDVHNPFILYLAYFYLDVPGIDKDTAVTGAFFSFGTQDVPAGVPEPLTFVLFGVGVVAVAGAAKKFARA